MGEMSDFARRRGVVPRRDGRGNFALQMLDWFVPANIYRYDEGGRFSRPDLIGAGAQMATGAPVAGLLSRMMGGGDSPRFVRNPERFQRDLEAIQARALGLPQGVRDIDFSREREEISRRAAEHERQREGARQQVARGDAGADGTTAAGRRAALGVGQLGSAGLAALLEYQNAINTRNNTMQER